MPLGPSSPSEDSGRNRERTVRENDVRQSGISNTGSQNTDGRASGYSPEPVDDTTPEVPDTSVLSVSARPYQKNKTAKYRLRVQDPNNDLVAAEYAVRRPETVVVQFARSPDIEWENQYDSNVHAYARLSDDFFRNEITGLLDSSLGRTEFRSIRFARSAEKPGVSSKSYNPDTNSTTWSRTPPSGSDPLWVIHGVINTSTTTLVENWSDPLRRVPYSWTEIKPKEEERGSSEYIISEPFKENGSDSFEIFWRVRHRPSQEKRGGNEFDRDPDAEFTANLRLLGQDARLELEGDEDTASYKVATSRGTVGFPDPSGGEYVEGRTFTGGNQINLGYLEPGQQINVSVRAYSDLSEDGNVKDGGQTRRLTLTTSQERPVPQVRFGLSKTGKFYSEYDGSYSYMQVSFNRGLTWEKAVDIEQESAASGEITSAYYFARGFGAPEINPFGDDPGSAWSDTPPTGESTLWVTSGPVDDTGTLAGGRWETPYPVVAEVPPKTLPPTEAAAQYSATDADPENAAAWDKTYDPDLNHEYIRLSWDQGNSWQSVHMETPTANPKDSDGKTITRNPVNRFTRSSTAPTVTDRTTYNGPDFTKWTDLPPTGTEDIWMISALADLDNDTLVAGDWSEPIRLRNLSDPGNLIEFGESAEGPWTPFYENDTTHFHLSLNNTLSWTGADQVSDAYFQKSDSQPTTPTDPSTNTSWAEVPEFSNAGSNQGEGTSGTPTWITRPDGVGGWTQPMKVRRDSGKRGPESDEVTIQYSADKVSWHDEFREGDVWMRQRVGEGVWQGPTRIVGEGGQNGVYLAYYFQANNSPDTAPKINANDDPTQDRGSGWVDGPGQALANGGQFVWGITAQFLVDQSQTEDIRQTDWDGPYRVNGEDATQRFIRPTNGTAIKNSNPNKTLGLETVEIKGSRESLISSGDPKLYVEDSGSYTTVSNYFSGISDDHQPTFSVTEIQGNLTVYLRDTDGNNLDTITLADLTDGVSAGYVLSPDGLAVTHYSGRDTDAVKPGSLPLIATFVDSEGTEHQQQINVNPTENASKNLEVSWSAATSSDSDPQSDQVGFTVKSNGASVTSPVTSPRELVFEFTGTDANTGEVTVFSEQVQFTEDDGIYKIKSLDGATLREGGDNLRFEVTRTDGEGTSTVGLTSGGFKLVLRPTGSATEFTGSPATIADSDLNTGPQTLQLQDGSGNVLDSITVIKASLGVSSLQVIDREQITENGSQVGKLTFEVADRYKDSVDTITTRKASGRNLKSGDAFGSDITGTESPPYTETVNLEEKRSSYIEVKVTYTDSQPTTRQTFSFDHDLRPEAKYIVPKGKAEPYLAVVGDDLEYQSYPAIQYYVSAQGDEDVASFRTVFIHAEGTSNEEKFVYERKGSVLDNVPLHPTKDLLDPSGFILGGATIREDLESGESRNDYTARVKVEAYSDWDPDANNGNGGVAGKKDQNAFDQQVGIEGGAFPEFTPEITRFNANPVHRGGGSALLSVGVNEDAEGFQINWKTFDKDGNLLQTYSDVNGDPSAIVDPGTAQFSAPTPPGPDATDSNGNNIGPGYGWIEVTPIGSPAYITENIKGESERISIGPSKAYNTLFSVTGGSSSTTVVGTDSSKSGQLNVEAISDDGGQKYNVNAPQDIGTSATPTFSGLDFGGSNSVNEITDDTSLADGSATSLPTENAVKTYVGNNRYTNSEAISAVTSEDPITFDGTVKAPTLNATSTLLLPTSSGSGGGSGGGSVADFDAGRSLFTESVDGSTVLNVELVSGSGINLTEASGANTNAYKISASVDAGVNTFAGRSGDVSPSTGDYSASQISGFNSAAVSAVGGATVTDEVRFAWSGQPHIEFYDTGDNRSFWVGQNNDSYLVQVRDGNRGYVSNPFSVSTDAPSDSLVVGSSDVTIQGNTVWHDGNATSKARSAVRKQDVGLSNVPNQDPRSQMRNLGLQNQEMDDSWVGGQGGGQVGYDASVGLFLDYGSAGGGVSKDVYPVLDAGNTKTGSNVNVTYGGIDTQPKISLSQGSGSGLDADKLDGKHASTFYNNGDKNENYLWFNDRGGNSGTWRIAITSNNNWQVDHSDNYSLDYISFNKSEGSAHSDASWTLKNGLEVVGKIKTDDELKVGSQGRLREDSNGNTILEEDAGGESLKLEQNNVSPMYINVTKRLDINFDQGGYGNVFRIYGNGDQFINANTSNGSLKLLGGVNGDVIVNSTLQVDNDIDLNSNGDVDSVNKLNVSQIDSNNSNAAINVTQPLNLNGNGGNSQNWELRVAGKGFVTKHAAIWEQTLPSEYANGEDVSLEIRESGNTAIQFNGSTAPYRINIQDGSGRVHHRWNAYWDGSNEKFDVGGEGASYMEMDGNGFYFKASQTDGSAGNSITWDTPLQLNGGTVDMSGANSVILPTV